MKKLLLALALATPVSAQTLMVGDSVFALTKVVPHLVGNATQVVDVSEIRAEASEITLQYILYTEDNPIPDMVIMNGGGNDVMRHVYNQCLIFNKECRDKVDETLEKLEFTIQRMKEDGVSRIIYLGIHYFQRQNKPLNRSVDYGMDKVGDICQGICVFVDVRKEFQDSGLLFIDDVHPNFRGSKIIADRIIEVLDPPYADWD